MKKNFLELVLLAVSILLCASFIFVLNGCNSDREYKRDKKNIPAIFNFRLGSATPQKDPSMSYNDAKEKCIALLKKRIEATGYPYSLHPEPDGTWTLTVNDIADTAGSWQMLLETGYMEFRETYSYNELENSLAQAVKKSKIILDSISKHDGKDSAKAVWAGFLQSYSTGSQRFRRAEIGIVSIKDSALLHQLLKDKAIASCFPAGLEFLMRNKGPHEGFEYIYATKTTLLPLTNRYVRSAEVLQDPQSNQMAVNFRFNEEGAKIWYDMTERAALQDHKAIVMCLDKKVLYAPLVDEAIDGGNCRIVLGGEQGQESIEHAHLLAIILPDGILPLQVVLNSKNFK